MWTNPYIPSREHHNRSLSARRRRIVGIRTLHSELTTRVMERLPFRVRRNKVNASCEIVDSAMPIPKSLLTSTDRAQREMG